MTAPAAAALSTTTVAVALAGHRMQVQEPVMKLIGSLVYTQPIGGQSGR